MKKFIFIAAGGALAALVLPLHSAAAQIEPLTLEERVKRLEETLALGQQVEDGARVAPAPPAGSVAQGGALTLEERVTQLEQMLALSHPADMAVPPPAAPSQPVAAAPPVLAISAPADAGTRPPVATPEPAVSGPIWSYTNNRPTIRSADGDFQMAFRGRFQFDSGTFFQDGNLPMSVDNGRDLKNGAYFRRAQIGIEGQVSRDFQYEFVYDFGSSGTERAGQIYLLRLAYVGIPNFTFHAGAIQPKFTMDDSTSSADITFMERSSIVNTILDPFGGSDSRRGAEMRYQKAGLFHGGDNLLFATAFTGDRIAAAKTDDENTQLLGRLAYRFFSNNRSNFQIGVNAAKILNEPSGRISFNDRPEVRADGARLAGFGSGALPAAIGAKTATLWGLEGGMNVGPLTMQGEFYRYKLDRTDAALRDPSFQGWYAQASYLLTGEMRPYTAASAAFGSPAPTQPFALDRGTWGAWEAKARYSVNDFNDHVFDVDPANRVRGGEQRILSMGLNWYLNRNVRWNFDYMLVDVDRLNAEGVQAGQNFDIFATRMQFSF